MTTRRYFLSNTTLSALTVVHLARNPVMPELVGQEDVFADLVHKSQQLTLAAPTIAEAEMFGADHRVLSGEVHDGAHHNVFHELSWQHLWVRWGGSFPACGRTQMTVEEKNAILSMHRQGYSSRKNAEIFSRCIVYNCSDLWKNVMKPDIRKSTKTCTLPGKKYGITSVYVPPSLCAPFAMCPRPFLSFATTSRHGF